MNILKKPPFETVADLSEFEVNPNGASLKNVSVEVEDGEGGIQDIPVGIYMPNARKHPNGTIGLRFFPWSASNDPEYQRARTQTYADTLGLPLVAVNTIGQGKGSPELTDGQKTALDEGDSLPVGKPMVEAAIKAYEEDHEPVIHVVILAESQGPSVTPGVIENLPENIDLSHVIWLTPAGTVARSVPNLWRTWSDNLLPGRNMAVYRQRNPEGFNKLKDTNLIESIRTQRDAHLLHYPRMMASGRLPSSTRQALKTRDLQPQIHILSAEHDSVSPLMANRQASDYLQAQLHELPGHYHTVEEYIAFIAKLYANILDVEVPVLSPGER